MTMIKQEIDEIVFFDLGHAINTEGILRNQTGHAGPFIGSVWKHYKGGLYQIIAFPNTDTKDIFKHPIYVLYRNVRNGTLWTRPLAEWASPKFIIYASTIEHLRLLDSPCSEKGKRK